MNKTALSLHDTDDVAVVLEHLAPGDFCKVRLPGGEIELAAVETIAFGHKIALRDIAAGESVHKYGEVIAVASVDIGVGQHVHVHNIV